MLLNLSTGVVASPRRIAPAPVAGLADATALVAGGDHTCAVRRTGSVVCWGAGFGKTPTAVPGVDKVADLSAGEAHTCARSNGALTCWGNNRRGQLGDGTTEDRAAGTRVRNLPDIKAVAAGAHHTCALTRTGGVMCWGSNDGAALGAGLLPSGGDDGQAGTVRNLTEATDITSGDGFSCAVASGSVQCWGTGGLGQLGDGSLADRSLAQPVQGLTDAVQVEAVCAAPWAVDALRIMLYQGGPLAPGVYMLDGGNGFAWLQQGDMPPETSNVGALTIEAWDGEQVSGSYSLPEFGLAGSFVGPHCAGGGLCG